MATRILLTTTSYQDTPGDHHAFLESQGYEIHRERGPLPESKMLDLAGAFDGILCGDDEISRPVLEKSLPRLQVLSKYGIGLDKIDLAACDTLGVPVLFTPGVNHTTVAEHTFALLLACVRHLVDEVNHTRAGEWTRLTGHELWRKRLGVVGLGRIGQEVVRRARGFEMEVHAFGHFWPEEFAAAHEVVRHESIEDLAASSDVLSLHTKLTDASRHLVDARILRLLPEGAILVNTSRGELVDNEAVIAALDSGRLAGYAADVLDQEPPPSDHPLLRHPKCLVTPHVGSRTYESVPRQAMKATRNLVNFLKGTGEICLANRAPLPKGSTLTLEG